MTDRQSNIGLLVTAAIIAFALMCHVAFGQTDADVRVRMWEGLKHFRGSGTAIYTGPTGSWVLTAEHNIRNASKVSVLDLNKRMEPATVIAKDGNLDVALLWTSLKVSQARPLAASFDASQPVYLTGWPGVGLRHRSNKTQAINRLDNSQFEFTGAAIQGQSGGAVTDSRGFVVGVTVATSHNTSFAPCGDAVFNFVRKSLVQYQYEMECEGGSCQIVPRQGYGYQQQTPRYLPQEQAPVPGLSEKPAPQQPQAVVPQIIETPKEDPHDGIRDQLGALGKSIQDNADKRRERSEELNRSLDEIQADLRRIDAENAAARKLRESRPTVPFPETPPPEPTPPATPIPETKTPGIIDLVSGVGTGWLSTGPIGAGIAAAGWFIGRRKARRAGGHAEQPFQGYD